MSDLAETLHQASFHKSGRANAPENQNPHFQSGFKTASKYYPKFDPLMIITAAHDAFGDDFPEELFREWKRGLWAAVMQKAAAAFS